MSIKSIGKKPFIFLVLLIINVTVHYGQESILIGEKYFLESQVLNESREFWVSLPKHYNDTVYAKKTYPVCYFFDGDSHFETLVALRNRLSGGVYANMPEMIMVGIQQKDRTKELTPTTMKTPADWKRADFSTSGGNGVFMHYIEDELKPLINKTYRTNEFSILIGHSFGGLAVMNTFVNHPERYNAYIALDPSLWWDNEIVLNQMNQNLQDNRYKGKTLILAKATDAGAGVKHHNANLKANEKLSEFSDQASWRYRFSVYQNEDHGSMVVPAEYDALRFVFEGYKLPVKQLMKTPELIEGHYKSVSENLGYSVIPEEWLLDTLATVCLRQDLIDQAKALLLKNTEYYPESAHAKARLNTLNSK
ncbi:alpha/beta hydrolase [Formosa sp. S-31]|uniref:alpha/beta hydrolase n=1 Tax=Formosa sp. S-31 TaxID=2790949 RepID=UPI003EBD8A0B